jgi:hypothetical protein
METIKSAKVTQVSGNGKWDSQQYGTFYKFEIVFDNGDSGQYMSKEPEQTKFKVGDEASYTITSKDVNGKLYYTIKPAMNLQQGKGGWKPQAADPEKEARISRMSVLKVATDIYINHGKMEINEIIPLAQIFEQWVMTGVNPVTKAETKPEPKKAENLFKADKGGIANNFLNDAVNEIENNLFNDFPPF